MNIIEDMKERVDILEHILKTVAGCTNCSGCSSIAKQYFDQEKLIKSDQKETNNVVNVTQIKSK